MKRVTVFCGSSSGRNPLFEKSAFALGELLATEDIALVYGGAKVGLMGAVANGALSKGGEVIGVLPHFLRTVELEHQGLTQLISVASMHERKLKMEELCDGVIALPGGYGTLEEFFEMLTWAQLGLHAKPVALLNVNGFYNDLLKLVHGMVEQGFLKEANQKMLLVHDDATQLIALMKNYQAPTTGKWISKNSV
ncbi:MAG TPA: TIGR00730 family Rossman fold protein [Cyclobacteriaceae bacterium]|jgi:uncharacterized protein (TIGR00730 family)|nr:TIGR00730 family Rossman fold protein [Cyclobacteriaceae bacterium]